MEDGKNVYKNVTKMFNLKSIYNEKNGITTYKIHIYTIFRIYIHNYIYYDICNFFIWKIF